MDDRRPSKRVLPRRSREKAQRDSESADSTLTSLSSREDLSFGQGYPTSTPIKQRRSSSPDAGTSQSFFKDVGISPVHPSSVGSSDDLSTPKKAFRNNSDNRDSACAKPPCSLDDLFMLLISVSCVQTIMLSKEVIFAFIKDMVVEEAKKRIHHLMRKSRIEVQPRLLHVLDYKVIESLVPATGIDLDISNKIYFRNNGVFLSCTIGAFMYCHNNPSEIYILTSGHNAHEGTIYYTKENGQYLKIGTCEQNLLGIDKVDIAFIRLDENIASVRSKIHNYVQPFSTSEKMVPTCIWWRGDIFQLAHEVYLQVCRTVQYGNQMWYRGADPLVTSIHQLGICISELLANSQGTPVHETVQRLDFRRLVSRGKLTMTGIEVIKRDIERWLQMGPDSIINKVGVKFGPRGCVTSTLFTVWDRTLPLRFCLLGVDSTGQHIKDVCVPGDSGSLVGVLEDYPGQDGNGDVEGGEARLASSGEASIVSPPAQASRRSVMIQWRHDHSLSCNVSQDSGYEPSEDPLQNPYIGVVGIVCGYPEEGQPLVHGAFGNFLSSALHIFKSMTGKELVPVPPFELASDDI